MTNAIKVRVSTNPQPCSATDDREGCNTTLPLSLPVPQPSNPSSHSTTAATCAEVGRGYLNLTLPGVGDGDPMLLTASCRAAVSGLTTSGTLKICWSGFRTE